MADPKKGPGKVGAAVIGFLVVALGGVLVTRDRDRKPSSVTPTATTETTATVHEPPTVPPVEPPIAEPQPTAAPTETPAPAPRRRRAVKPAPPCTSWQAELAKTYALNPGYEDLKNDCGQIAKAHDAGVDIVIWRARHGYNSPSATCPFMLVSEIQAGYGPNKWNAVNVTIGGEERVVSVDVSEWENGKLTYFADFPCTSRVMKLDRVSVDFGWCVPQEINGIKAASCGFRDALETKITALPIPDRRRTEKPQQTVSGDCARWYKLTATYEPDTGVAKAGPCEPELP